MAADLQRELATSSQEGVGTAALSHGVLPASVLLRAERPAWLARWSDFAAGLTFADLPGETVCRAKLVLLDTIGAVAAGMQEPELRALLARLPGQGAGAPAIGSGRLWPDATAALLNGIAGTTLELDEGNQYARGHPGIHVVPAALAATARRDRTGADLILALTLGYEIGARIGIASKLRVAMHPHGTWGTVGAALAVACLDRASPALLAETVSIASSLGLATSRRTMLEGATVRNAYAGISNQLGLLAFHLAAAGFGGEADGIGSVFGGIVAEDFRPDLMTDALGERWEIARNYFKRHAACRYTHGALDALATLAAEAGGRIDPDAVESVAVDTYVWAAQLDGDEPRTMLAAKFSLPFALATALVHGEASVTAFRDEARSDARVRALARRVVVREDPAFTAALPDQRPARVRLKLADGRVLAAEVRTNRGDTEDPYGPDEVRDKFRELAEPVWGSAHADRLIAAVDGLDAAPDLAPLSALLAAAPRAAMGSAA
jgi:2-methylcitrate dehydratase PrpD